MKHKAEVIASLEAELATQNRETAAKLQKKV